MAAEFFEIFGVLESRQASAVSQHGCVIFSKLAAGAAPSEAQPTGGIKYVAAGTEVYRYGGKTYAVNAGHFLVLPEGHAGEIEIARSETDSTIGLCVFLPSTIGEQGGRLEAPMIFSARCSTLGQVLTGAVHEMMRPRVQRSEVARRLIAGIGGEVEPLLADTVRMIDGVDALKPSTRYETMRRLNIARGHLHEVTDRPVELAELAKVAGISRFQLLRNFRDAFGAPPAAYHRNLRLQLAREEVERRRLTCSEAAHRFGFADCSSFSHAYRRLFGEAPIRSLAA